MSATLLFLLACAPAPSRDLFTGALAWEDAWPGGDEAAALFGLERVTPVEIDLSAEARAALEVDPYEYVAAGLVADGEALGEVGVRLKGRSGSFRDLDGKPSFKIDLDRYDPARAWRGLRRVDLDNLVVDCSAARDRLALRAFAAAGQPAPRAGYARVALDGEDLGLYGLIENVDRGFLDLRWPDGSGNLYDGDYKIEGDFESQVDFVEDLQDLFDLDEGHDVNLADIHAITSVLDGGFLALEEPAQFVDWPRVARMFAMELYVGQVDGYALQANNYRVYFDPRTGRAELIPWDMDFAFTPAAEWDVDPRNPAGRLAYECVHDDACLGAFQHVLARVLATLDAFGLDAELAAVDALVRPELATDPRSECSLPDHDADIAWLRSWLAAVTPDLLTIWATEL